ncbi:MAG: glutamate 5-kinase [Desulfitobacterium hafniense]|nr:glutamate 5-kinase [Desulfitobacterium hafniense]
MNTVRRILFKVGSSSLNHPDGGLNEKAIEEITRIISEFHHQGVECILVSSGAVAAGMGKLGLKTRPRDIAGKQAAAAVGQGVLMERYAHYLGELGLIGAQVLLSRIDLAEAARYKNAQNTLERLLRLNVVPIINENDTVAVEELCFGDNDRLSAMVAGLVHADLLIILTDVDGLYTANPKTDSTAQLIEEVQDISKVENMASGAGSMIGTGGMVTKLKAAEIATRCGIAVLLLNSARMGESLVITSGNRPKGTYFAPSSHRLVGKKKWIAYAGLSEGTIIIDNGAVKALVEEGKSLLAKGIIRVEGTWERKELVKITDSCGQEIARGIAELSSEEVDIVKGCHSEQLHVYIKNLGCEEVVHRDNLTLMTEAYPSARNLT